MKISAFTFLRNAHMLGYPFEESIRSVLPLCDEFIVYGGTEKTTASRRRRPGPFLPAMRARLLENDAVQNVIYLEIFLGR
jgi:hypothetical protein